MLATFMSLTMALLLCTDMYLIPGVETKVSIFLGYFELFFMGSLFFSLLPWIGMLFLSQGAEVQPITIAALRSNLADRKLYAYSGAIVAVAFLGIFVSFQSQLPQIWTFSVVLLCAGLILDLLRMAYCRLQYRRTPEGLAEWFIEVMKESVKRGDEKWHAICFEIPFALMVIYMKCGAYGSLRLFCHGIIKISDLWLGSIAHLRWFKVPGEQETSLLDQYAHAERMTAKRIGWIIQEACNTGSIAAVEEATRLAGNLFVTFHNCHASLGSILLSTLMQASQKECGKIGTKDLDIEVISTFSEMVKSLIQRCVARNISDTAPIFKILDLMEVKMKEIVRREKNISLALLTRPLAEITHMLGFGRYLSFQYREVILADVNRILALFPSMVGATSHIVEHGGEVADTKSSFKDDLPFSHPHRNGRRS